MNHNSVFSILLVLLVSTSTISVASGQLVTFDLQEKNILDFKKIDEQTQQKTKLSYKIGLTEQFNFASPGDDINKHTYAPPKLIKKISISEGMNFGPNDSHADSFVRLIEHSQDRRAILERISLNKREISRVIKLPPRTGYLLVSQSPLPTRCSSSWVIWGIK